MVPGAEDVGRKAGGVMGKLVWKSDRYSFESAAIGGTTYAPTVKLTVGYVSRERGTQPTVRIYLKDTVEGDTPGGMSTGEAKVAAVSLARKLIAENLAALREADAALAEEAGTAPASPWDRADASLAALAKSLDTEGLPGPASNVRSMAAKLAEERAWVEKIQRAPVPITDPVPLTDAQWNLLEYVDGDDNGEVVTKGSTARVLRDKGLIEHVPGSPKRQRTTPAGKTRRAAGRGPRS